jgi:hypothetical protein
MSFTEFIGLRIQSVEKKKRSRRRRIQKKKNLKLIC